MKDQNKDPQVKMFYEPTDNARIKQLLEKARKTNKKRDQSERRDGFSAPPDCPLSAYLRNSICAVISGLSTLKSSDTGSINCIAEGLVMAQDIEVLLREKGL